MNRLLSILAVMLLPAAAYPTIIPVPLDQASIQAAVDIAVNGDTVLVSPGTYTENILVDDKEIVIISSQGPGSRRIH